MRKARYLAVAILSCLALLVFMLLSVSLNSNNRLCTGCHEMRESAATWQQSTHSQYKCTDCHKLNLVDRGSMVVGHLSGSSINTMSQVSCFYCHNQDRAITPSKDIVIPHKRHLSNNIGCNRCHPAAGHLDLAQSKDLAQTGGNMALCLNCHGQHGGPLNCRSCHRDPPITLAHLGPGWKSAHGLEAGKSISDCNTCHKFTLFLTRDNKQTLEQTLVSPVQYARNNRYCADCHRTRPLTHNANFLHDHAYSAKGREASCLVCHNWDYRLPGEKIPPLSCQPCHAYRGWVPHAFSEF